MRGPAQIIALLACCAVAPLGGPGTSADVPPTSAADGSAAAAVSGRFELDGRHRGVGWEAHNEVRESHFPPLVEHNIDWIAQTPFGWQRGPAEPELALVTGGRVLWGETDEGLRVTTELARSRGIRTLLKPHVWVRDGWRGDLEMASDADWDAWFADYRRFILHYARFAQEHGIEALCVGTELHRTVLARPDDWRDIIAEVRRVYDGRLTYAANWYREFQEVPFWDDLDWIGIQAYFPLTESEDPPLEELLDGWRPWVEAIREVQRRHDRPVLFTEAGYRSGARAAAAPWEWPQRDRVENVDLDLQERLYEALFRTFWDEEWFAGVYWWKWHPPGGAGVDNNGFSPQDKPAARVLARWFDDAPGR